LIAGGARHLALIGAVRGETLEWKKPFRDTAARILERAGDPVCVLASGDPYWFGAGAVLAEYVAPSEMLVLPASSTFSLAAARLGWPLQSTLTLGLHTGRPEALLRYLHQGQRILALSLDGSTPGQAAGLLNRYGFGGSVMHIMEALGGPRERVHKRLAKEIAGETFAALNIIAIEAVAGPDARPVPFAPGLPDSYFEHDGQITKREIRAVTLSSLGPAPGELLWDIGLGSGSVAIEWLLSHASMRACGFEKPGERAARAARNAVSLGVPHLAIREGMAPAALEGAEAPDAIFVGGGVSEPGLMAAAWTALKPGGRIAANAVTLEGQAVLMECKWSWGGTLTRICIEREHRVGDYTAWQPSLPVVQWAAVKPWP
ncbi:MAG: precorrin-6y C5,15-methyltransferase (decarboxylating) subunit CbiE, partial [Rhodomicrobium sp.]|nr:precorrin-6y C5,15-methyltransferase (decarboxylating) subunit CbiE [Rhodomicrobium sp.]